MKILVIIDKLDANNFLRWKYGTVKIRRIESEDELFSLLNDRKYKEVAVYTRDSKVLSFLFRMTDRLTEGFGEYQFDGSDDVLIITFDGDAYSAVLIEGQF